MFKRKNVKRALKIKSILASLDDFDLDDIVEMLVLEIEDLDLDDIVEMLEILLETFKAQIDKD